MVKVRLVRIVVLFAAIGLVATACADSSGLEADLADAEAQIAELEAELFAATSTTEATVAIIEGTISLSQGDYTSISNTAVCGGKGGYDDIRPGADVVVRDGSGSVIGSSSLEPGSAVHNDETNRSTCISAFSVEVPADSDFYEVEISHRGGLMYSNAEMVAQDWTVDFSLG